MSTRLAEAIGKVATDRSERNALSAVLGVKTELAIANNQRRWPMIYSERDREITWLSQETAMGNDVGDDEGIRKAQSRLLTVMGTLQRGEDAPSGTAAQGSDDKSLEKKTYVIRYFSFNILCGHPSMHIKGCLLYTSPSPRDS